MNFARSKPFYSLAVAAAFLAMVIGCAKTEHLKGLETVFESKANPMSVKVNFCTDPAYNQKQYLKTIIILDHSASNKENYKMIDDGGGAPLIINGTIDVNAAYGTDPTGQTRYGTVNTPGTLLNYLANLPANDPSDPALHFALVDFNSSSTTYPRSAQGFTSDIPGFYNYVLNDSGQNVSPPGTPNDTNNTSYISALGSAQDIINYDIQQAKNSGVQTASAYVIVFMSDGSPIINFSGVGRDANGDIRVTGPISITKEATNQIMAKTASIMALTADAKYVTSVNFFTIYYYYPGNIDSSAQALLQQMATVGNGVSYNALSGSNIDYTRFQPPKKRIRFQLKDVFVTNNSLAWNNETLDIDADQDGLADSVELDWGSDPTIVSTNNNGVSDLVKYRMATNKSTGQFGASVNNLTLSVCNNVPRSGGVYRSSDPNGLNDCEKILLNDGGGIDNPDSNSDLIPDWLELKNGIPFQIGTVSAINTPDQDGYSIYDKIKHSLPLSIPTQQLISLQPTDYKMNLISSDGSQDCYKLEVTDFPTGGDGNTVRVDIIMKSDLLRDTFLYRIGKKSFALGAQTLEFNDWTDSAEQIANTWKMWP